MNTTLLNELINVQHPIIMAPMFLVTNIEMMLAADRAKIAGCIPALNFRTIEEFSKALEEMKKNCQSAFGINLIVNKSNIYYREQLDKLLEYCPDFVITSLGNPKEVINKCRPKGIKVFCDVTDLKYSLKVEELGADALIAVNSGAGGHAGKIPATVLIPMLKKQCKIPVISAGGVSTGEAMAAIMLMGASGLSIGSPFIATTEAKVNEGYKKACVDYGAQDISLTTKLSGTPCTVIETPYVKKIGTRQNLLEEYLNNNRQLKKYAKMLTMWKGGKLLEKAAFSATYKSVYCAGPSIEFVHEIRPIEDIVNQLMKEFKDAQSRFCQL